MQGIHANGTFRHYDVHSLYGHIQTEVTLRSLFLYLLNWSDIIQRIYHYNTFDHGSDTMHT